MIAKLYKMEAAAKKILSDLLNGQGQSEEIRTYLFRNVWKKLPIDWRRRFENWDVNYTTSKGYLRLTNLRRGYVKPTAGEFAMLALSSLQISEDDVRELMPDFFEEKEVA